MMWNLLNPDQLALVREDRSRVTHAFAESLRFAPPAQMIMRQPSEDVEVSGGTIPAGATVVCLIAAANRDPRKYSDPDRFDITPPGPQLRDRVQRRRQPHRVPRSAGTSRRRDAGEGRGRDGDHQLLDAMDDIELLEPPPVVGVFARHPELEGALHARVLIHPARRSPRGRRAADPRRSARSRSPYPTCRPSPRVHPGGAGGAAS